MAHLSMAILVFTAAMHVPTADPLAVSEQGQAFFHDLLRAASWGMTRGERAAFIISKEDGSLRCVMWQSLHTNLIETWRGPVPNGTVAIVHTHPIEWPQPSTHDFAEATRLGLPIYVVTPHRVTKAAPRHPGTIVVAGNESWLMGQTAEKSGCETSGK